MGSDFEWGRKHGLWGDDGIPHFVKGPYVHEEESYNHWEYEENEEWDDDDALTYDEWQENGYQVMRGEKSHRKNGKALFYFSQTKPIDDRSDETEEWDDDDELTYEEWQEHGYQVMRGEKSHRKSGKALFYFSQTMAI